MLESARIYTRAQMAIKQQAAMRDGARRALLAVVIVVAVLIMYAIGRKLLAGNESFTIEQTQQVTSSVDGLQYRVHSQHVGSQKAADTLATLNGRVIELMRWLRTRYARGPDGAAYPDRKHAVQRLLARYNPDNLAENSPKDPTGDTSYTIDKGAVVALCLRERGAESASIHDLNTLTFVTLHEMGHIAIEDVDHPPRFWSAFRFLLEEAEAAGIYTSKRYEDDPEPYCGVKIDYNPRWDPNNPSL